MPNSSPPRRKTVPLSPTLDFRRLLDLLQQRVAGRMAETVVHVLEVVDVDQKHRGAATVSLRSLLQRL